MTAETDPNPRAGQAPAGRTPEFSISAGVGLLLASAAVLALQVLQTRILSVQMWHHHSYMVVTMALLGFGAAGSIATIFPGLIGRHPARNASLAATLFAPTTLLGFLLLSATADTAAEMTAERRYLSLSLFYGYLILPYLCGGLVVTIALSAAARVTRLYAWNLLGSALGAWLFLAAVTPLGAERLLVLCACLGPLAGLALAGSDRSRPPARGSAILAVVVLIACGVAFQGAGDWFQVNVASNKYMAYTLRNVPGAKHLEQRWSTLCRLDLVQMPPTEIGPSPIHVYQDGDAITVMHTDESFKAQMDTRPVALNQLAYEPHVLAMENGERAPRALAIGIGGGIDLRFAMRMGAESVLGIEINPVTIELVDEDFAEINGDPYDQPGVEVRWGEGRASLRRLEETYDVIELSGTDTYTAGNAGAYVLSESYLYTYEALTEYFERLDPERGSLGILRLGYDPPRENLRLYAIALTVLRDEFGIEDPSRHAMSLMEEIVLPETGETIRFSGNVFTRQPMSDELIERFAQADLVPEWRVAWLPGQVGDEGPYGELGRAIADGTEDEFYASYPFDVRPVTDDSPFFFHFHRLREILPFGNSGPDLAALDKFSANPRALEGDDEGRLDDWHDLAGGPIGLEILGALLLQSTLLVTLLVLLPLFVLQRRNLGAPSAGRHLVYFVGLGAGFMFLEISTMQRLVLFLGHPTYSITVTLSCFLFFAGLGSLIAGRFRTNPVPAMRAAVAFIALYAVGIAFFLEPVLDAALHLGLVQRIGLVVLVLAPINIAMGMPFPLGLARLQSIAPRLVPWALGTNGGASVVASIACIVLAMSAGFQVVTLCAAALYGVGVLLETTGKLAPGRAESGR